MQLLSKSLLHHVLAHDMHADSTHNSFQPNNIMFYVGVLTPPIDANLSVIELLQQELLFETML